MVKLLFRLIINAVAIWAAAYIVEGVTLDMDRLGAVAVVALVFGVVNAVLKPIAKFLSFPAVVLTLGLFTLVINAGLFALTAYVTEALAISGFIPALLGSLIVSFVSWLLGLFLDDDDDDD